jgi:hypothetical protein
MFTNPGFTLADQFFGIVDCFRKTMWAEPRTRGLGALSVAIWARVQGFERRFSKLYGLWKTGKLPAPRAGAVAHPSPSRFAGPSLSLKGRGIHGADGASTAALDAARERPASVLPRAFRWLQRMLPWSAGMLAAGTESLLWNYPEMKAFAADCPQAGRILRPMCRMAGLKPPEWLALPKRPRVRKSGVPQLGEKDAEELRRLTARFPDTPAARSAKRALARSLAGLPVNLEKMSAVARGYFVHPPRDGNCPPPEIGYGGRRRPLPKDYVPPKDWE